MKNTILLLASSGILALSATAQIPASASGTPQGKIAANPAVKPAAGAVTSNNVKLNPGSMRKLVTPPVLLHPPGLIQGEQLLTAANPSEGPRQTQITITGSKFGNSQADLQVKINGVAAIVTGMSDNQILCIVPDRCGSGPITVGVKGAWTSGVYFVYDWAVNFTAFAGVAGSPGYLNGGQGTGRMHTPIGLCKDPSGNFYLADAENNCVRKINAVGEMTTLAGNTPAGYADGMGAAAKFLHPTGIACDNAGNVYVSEENKYIRKIAPNGTVTTFAGSGRIGVADGRGAAASFSYPGAMAFDGNYLYVVDGQKLRKIDLSGNVTTVAGVGSVSALTYNPATREILFGSNTTVNGLSPNGQVRFIAGNPRVYGHVDGYGQDATFVSITGLAVDGAGNIYVSEYNTGSDQSDSFVRRISRDGMVTTPWGEKVGYQSHVWQPGPMVTDNSGAVYIADRTMNCILKMTLQ